MFEKYKSEVSFQERNTVKRSSFDLGISTEYLVIFGAVIFSSKDIDVKTNVSNSLEFYKTPKIFCVTYSGEKCATH